MITPIDDQVRILDSPFRFNVISGNAGSAKTTTLAMKIVHTLRQGRPAQEVLALTYSEAAVPALQQRLRWLGLSRDQVLKVPVRTFAHLCHQRIAPFEGRSRHLSRPNRLVHDTLVAAVSDARARAGHRGHLAAFEIAGDGLLAFPTLLQAFRLLKGTLVLQSLGNEFVLTLNSEDSVFKRPFSFPVAPRTRRPTRLGRRRGSVRLGEALSDRATGSKQEASRDGQAHT